MSFDAIIDVYDRHPIAPRYRTNSESLLASAYKLVDDANSALPLERQILRSSVQEIVYREGTNPAIAQRAVMQFIATTENPKTNTPTQHTDLLHPGHPLSTVEVTPYRARNMVAQYFSGDPNLEAEVRPIVASAIAAEPNSAQRKFFLAQLSAKNPGISYLGIISQADVTLASK